MSAGRNVMIGGVQTLIHLFVVPVFILFFLIFYQPRGVYALLEMERASFSFNVTMLFCIILLSISITRGSLYLIGKNRGITRGFYAVWCVAEMVVASLFSSLYVTLMLAGPVSFFEVAGALMVLVVTSGMYPYVFLWLGFELRSKNSESTVAVDENSLIRFYDEYKKLRLVIAHEAVLYIKSEENYVQIHYLDQGKTRKFVLRSSMKALETSLAKHGLVRCHRSYFVNPAHIRIVHRNSAGLIVAELRHGQYDSIPISRKYQDDITKML